MMMIEMMIIIIVIIIQVLKKNLRVVICFFFFFIQLLNIIIHSNGHIIKNMKKFYNPLKKKHLINTGHVRSFSFTVSQATSKKTLIPYYSPISTPKNSLMVKPFYCPNIIPYERKVVVFEPKFVQN